MSKKAQKEKSCESTISRSCGIFLRNFFRLLVIPRPPPPPRFTDKQLSWLLFIHQRLRNNNFVVFSFLWQCVRYELRPRRTFFMRKLFCKIFAFRSFSVLVLSYASMSSNGLWNLNYEDKAGTTGDKTLRFFLQNFEKSSSVPQEAKISSQSSKSF